MAAVCTITVINLWFKIRPQMYSTSQYSFILQLSQPYKGAVSLPVIFVINKSQGSITVLQAHYPIFQCRCSVGHTNTCNITGIGTGHKTHNVNLLLHNYHSNIQ